jgi:basic amino acid/polyamine antiporter, APA family
MPRIAHSPLDTQGTDLVDINAGPSTERLRRSLGLFDATMIVAGSMIGSGIFLVTAPMARDLGSTGWLLASWGLTAFLTLAAALSYGELAAMMPFAGGQYVYLREAFSPLLGFLYGWTLFLVIQTGIIAAVAVGFARYLGLLFPGVSESTYLVPPIHLSGNYAISLSPVQLLAIAVIVVLTWINSCGLRYGKLLQNVFTVSKLAALGAVIIVGLIFAATHGGFSANLSHPWAVQPAALASSGLRTGLRHPLLVALCLAQVGSLFAADAWNNVTFIAGEIINPKRTLVVSLTFGTLLVMALYLFANLAYVAVLPLPQIAHAPSDRVGGALLEAILPRSGGQIIAVVILVASIGCINSMILAGARTYYAMAKDGLFLPAASRLNTASVPGVALWLQSGWAAVLLLIRTYNPSTHAYGNLYSNLLDYVIASALIFYMATIAAVFRLRWTRPLAERPYRTPGYPVLPAIYIAGAFIILVVLAIYRTGTTGPGLLIIVLGVPFYFLFRRALPQPQIEATDRGESSRSTHPTPDETLSTSL